MIGQGGDESAKDARVQVQSQCGRAVKQDTATIQGAVGVRRLRGHLMSALFQALHPVPCVVCDQTITIGADAVLVGDDIAHADCADTTAAAQGRRDGERA